MRGGARERLQCLANKTEVLHYPRVPRIAFLQLLVHLQRLHEVLARLHRLAQFGFQDSQMPHPA
jgi:hypothetical protein